MMSKIQNLNGTLNNVVPFVPISIVVYDVKDTKFEWNSQPINNIWSFEKCCLWCQRYKIWMELTTHKTDRIPALSLFMMSKIQNLNGTHNNKWFFKIIVKVVYDVKDTKFEWNSQHDYCRLLAFVSCLWCQRYKIWMELTTPVSGSKTSTKLFMITKIQKLSAIHNPLGCNQSGKRVVYDYKDTKIVSNSQRWDYP